MSERVTISVEGGIADVRLARPGKLNALDPAQISAIADALARLAAMADLRCVVLSGEGRAFCAGLDFQSVAGDPALLDLIPRTHGVANLFQHIALGWRALPVPVIAAVHGVAFGGGAQIMLGADMRIAAPDARISLMEMRWGLVPDMAATVLLRGLVRDDVARELVYTGRQVGGEDAAALGLVTRLAADPLAEAMTLARTIAANSPEAIRAAKRLMNRTADADEAALLEVESREQQALLGSDGHRRALAEAAQATKAR